MRVIGASSRPDAACGPLCDAFEENVVVPRLIAATEVEALLREAAPEAAPPGVAGAMAEAIVGRLGSVGVKTALRLAERAAAVAEGNEKGGDKLVALNEILEDVVGDEAATSRVCEVF